jgi:diphthamide synthase subunit DPH2
VVPEKAHAAKVGGTHRFHSHGLTLRPSTKVDRLRPYARAVPHAGLLQSCNCTTPLMVRYILV